MQSLISVDEATHAVHAQARIRATETVALTDAVGRVLADDIIAERAHPPFDRVTTDGIATRWLPVMPALLRVVGAQTPGHHGQALHEASACIEVASGALLPEGCDCVIPIEHLVRNAQGYTLAPSASPSRGQCIHRQGADCPADALVLEAGTRIGAPQMAVLAANGQANVKVVRQPSVAIVTTGEALLDVSAPLQPGRIRRSSDLAMMAALHAAGITTTTLQPLPEDPDVLGSSLSRLLQTHDVLVLSGGVSLGQRDYLPTTLESVGVVRVFQGVAQSPGQPMWFGMGAAGQRVFALPGNPVSALVCMARFVRPALLSAMGLPIVACEQVRLAAALPAHVQAQFVPVRLRREPGGEVLAQPLPPRSTSDVTTLAATDGFVEVPAGLACPVGQPLPLYRW
ncbi:molybdopterin molybdotransferase MoeA [Stenotrophomonas sp. PS02289]|uniref:molybdopterin molybdotransferase MoeA n=1 Tax=Stenotrophomonas sp. PS02289 TaxID=2991422 RepID=UPI00249A2E9C|nr:molybdopterin molybdotransferase MoeA [Stenotrophomonas sp. PS02289]